MFTTRMPSRARGLRALAAALAALLAACSSGSGGKPNERVPQATGTFTRTYTSAANFSLVQPFWGSQDSKDQFLYTAEQVGGSGRMTAIRFHVAGTLAAAVTCRNMSFRLGHTSLHAFQVGSRFAENVDSSSLLPVLEATVTIPAGSERVEIPFTTPFEYDRVSNLVVEVEAGAACTPASVPVRSGYVASTRAHSLALTDPSTPPEYREKAQWCDGWLPSMQFVFSGGETLAAPGGAIDANAPPFTSKAPLRTQHLVLRDDIDGSGPVTGIAFSPGSDVAIASTYEVTVKMGHTSLAQLGTRFDDNYVPPDASNVATVAKDLTFTIPEGTPAGGWFWVPLTGSFEYNGRDNLVVEIQTQAGTADTSLRHSQRAGAYLRGAGLPATGTELTTPFLMKLRFNGAPITFTGSEGLDPGWGALGGGTGMVQALYDSSLLGTGGTIESVGIRVADPTPTPVSVQNVSIFMGSTHKTELSTSDTYSSNMDGQTLVYRGSLSIPAGLARGDWVTIPLQTPYVWDPGKNLTVLFGADAAAGAPSNWYFFGAHGFPAHSVYEAHGVNSGDPSSTPDIVNDGLLSVKLHVSR